MLIFVVREPVVISVVVHDDLNKKKTQNICSARYNRNTTHICELLQTVHGPSLASD